MPTYVFCCPQCGWVEEEIRPMKDSKKSANCRKCKSKMKRAYAFERPHIGDKEYSRPIHSDSLAIMPSQRAEHEKNYPDIKLDNECRPIFDSYKSHQKYLDAIGARKSRQRKKRRGKKLTSK